MILSHNARCEPKENQPYEIALARTQPHLGGTRWWFLFPQTGRRVSKLYLPLGKRRFLSRAAYKLVRLLRS
jgi:hypothetical protein